MRLCFLPVQVLLVSLFLACCTPSYDVRIIKVHEMIQDMEAIELDEPDRVSDLPETGILVNNDTDTTIQMKMRREKENIVSVPPGGSASMALSPGSYHYKISADPSTSGKKSKVTYIDLNGRKKIVEKCMYIYDVFTKQEILKEKELEALRSR